MSDIETRGFTPVYEDNHVIAVIKEPNIPVQEDYSGDPDLQNLLKGYIKRKYQRPGNVFVALVHRLDRPASGIMIFARTSKAASRIADQFRRKKVGKTYLAVVEGNPPEEAELRDFLYKDNDRNLVSVVGPDQPKAKEAILRMKCLQRRQGLALIEVDLVTGRSHQIRVQCSHAGFPLWGDYKYGFQDQPERRNMALLSRRIEFEHPVKKERITFYANVREDEPWNIFDPLPPVPANPVPG